MLASLSGMLEDRIRYQQDLMYIWSNVFQLEEFINQRYYLFTLLCVILNKWSSLFFLLILHCVDWTVLETILPEHPSLVFVVDRNDRERKGHMQWFFTLANRNNGVMKNTLAGKKPMYVKKSRGRWLVIRFIGIVNLREGPTNLELFPLLEGLTWSKQ